MATFSPIQVWVWFLPQHSIKSTLTKITSVTFHPTPHISCQHLILNLFIFRLIFFLLCNTALFWVFLLEFQRSFLVTLQASLSHILMFLRFCSGLCIYLTLWDVNPTWTPLWKINHKSWCWREAEFLPPPNMSLWHKEYLELVILKKLQTQEKL